MWPQRIILTTTDKKLGHLSSRLVELLTVLTDSFLPRLPPIGADKESDLVRYFISSRGSSLVFVPKPHIVSFAKFHPYWLEGEIFSPEVMMAMSKWATSADMQIVQQCVDIDYQIQCLVTGKDTLSIPEGRRQGPIYRLRGWTAARIAWEVGLFISSIGLFLALFGGAHIGLLWRVVALLLSISYDYLYWHKLYRTDFRK